MSDLSDFYRRAKKFPKFPLGVRVLASSVCDIGELSEPPGGGSEDDAIRYCSMLSLAQSAGAAVLLMGLGHSKPEIMELFEAMIDSNLTTLRNKLERPQ